MRLWLSLPLALFLLFFGLAPLAFLFAQGYSSAQTSVSESPLFWQFLRLTYWQAFLSATLSVALGGGLAWYVVESESRWSAWIWRVALVCTSLPTLLVILSLLAVWGNSGLGSAFLSDGIYGWPGILLAHVFLNFAIPLRLIGLALLRTSREQERVALSLGASRAFTFFSVTFRKIIRPTVASWVIVFSYCATSFLVLLILGGGPKFTTLEVMLYEAIKMNLDLRRAVQLGSISLCVSALLFALSRWLTWEEPPETPGSFSPFYWPRSKTGQRIAHGTVSLLLFGLLVLPLLALGREGLLGVSELNGLELLSSLGFTVCLALVVGAGALLLSYPALHLRRHDPNRFLGETILVLLSFSGFFSSLLVSLAILVSYPSFRDTSLGPWLAVACVQILFCLPLVSHPIRDGLARYSQEQEWAAASLGATVWQRFSWVQWPQTRRAVLTGLLLAVGFSLGEVTTVILFAPSGVRTLAVHIFTLMGRYSFQGAYAAGVVLLLVLLAVFFVLTIKEERHEIP